MKTINPKEFKVMALRDCPVPSDMLICQTPQQIADYWHLHIAKTPHFNPECECLAVLMLNTRRRVKGHQLVTIGTMDTILVHPREVFRCAIIAAASAIALTAHGNWHGYVTQSPGGRVEVFIRNPPPALERHPHWTCFHKRNDGWFFVHPVTPVADVSAGI